MARIIKPRGRAPREKEGGGGAGGRKNEKKRERKRKNWRGRERAGAEKARAGGRGAHFIKRLFTLQREKHFSALISNDSEIFTQRLFQFL